jgi:hypothetical protein
MEDFEYDDSSSNPLSDTHLPVGGELDAFGGSVAPDINDDMIAGIDEESGP